MPLRPPKKTFAFVVPTLNELAAQNEDVVQLLLFAAAYLAQEAKQKGADSFAAIMLAVEPDLRGWKHLTSLFPKHVLEQITVEVLPEPVTANLAIASHKPAYHLFEYLKHRTFDEVHCHDRCGLVYYATQAKQLGLYCLNTLFAVHIVGGTLFHDEVEDKLLDEVSALMDDLLERGSVERADVTYVHDRKAWRWYTDKVNLHTCSSVQDLAWPQLQAQIANPSPIIAPNGIVQSVPIVFYGLLSAADGLPIFCDALDRLLPTVQQPVEVCFMGAAQGIGGMDAVSYIHLRSAKWKVPVTIKRNLSIAEEIAALHEVNGVVVYNTLRREGLRARLIAGSTLSVLQIDQAAEASAQALVLASPTPIE